MSSEQLMSEEKHEGDGGVSHVPSEGRAIQMKETTGAKALRQGFTWFVRSSGESSVAEAEGARGRVAEGSVARLQRGGEGTTEALVGALAFIVTQANVCV